MICGTARWIRLVMGFAALAGSLRGTEIPGAWNRDQLQAWCIVPYDAKKRSPEARAEMLRALGLTRLAYDYRPQHVPTFDREVLAMKSQGITITAWWFPRTLDDTAAKILGVIERHGITPELWVTGGGEPVRTAEEQAARITSEAERLRPIVVAAARLGCNVGLYNHGGWFGEPDNQLQVLARLRSEGHRNVGLVYNFHHGHDHIRNFAHLWPRISAETMAVNVNGMEIEGDRNGRKIHFVGAGTEEAEMIRIIVRSGWRGTVGVLSHRDDADAAETLQRNLSGLEQILQSIRAAGAKVPGKGP